MYQTNIKPDKYIDLFVKNIMVFEDADTAQHTSTLVLASSYDVNNRSLAPNFFFSAVCLWPRRSLFHFIRLAAHFIHGGIFTNVQHPGK